MLGKDCGGLGYRDFMMWNKACFGKYVQVVASKQDNVWIKWVNIVYPTSSKLILEENMSSQRMKQFYSQAELSNLRKYSIQEVYENIKGVTDKIQWDKMI